MCASAWRPPGQPLARRGAEFLRHGLVEGRGLDQQVADLLEQQPAALVLGRLVDIAEVPPAGLATPAAASQRSNRRR
jgi:hypothetical protein